MKTPRQFQLAGTTWRVVYCAPKHLPGEYAHCDFESRIIRVQRGLAPELETAVFLHELLHAMLWTVGDENYADEAYVTARANLLHQFLTTAK